jgi:hypothetical protein
MANWYGSARSNYFAVKDEAAFREWADKNSLQIFISENHPGLFAIAPSNDGDDGGWPSLFFDDETGEDRDFEVTDEIVPHLAEGHVAVLMEIGAEKLRYLTGHATAVSSNGASITINLRDIYEKAAELGGTVTQATY